MPVIGIPVNMLLSRIETTLDRDALVEQLQYLGCDVEGYTTMRRFGCTRCGNLAEITETENPPVICERCGADYKESPELLEPRGESDVLRMELLAVRPDMFEPGGLARVLRNYLGEREEPARYALQPPSCRVEVDPRLAEPRSLRPFISCAIVRELTLDDDIIRTVMKLQENLHWALGRDRKRASIGVYDLDRVQGPAFSYRAVAPEALRFVPLGYDPAAEGSALTPREILEQHPKGIAYARLLADFARYPLLADAEGRVLSMPPIINSEQTRVVANTRNFFIDVTGTEQRVVDRALNTIVTSMIELDPRARIEQVTIVAADGERQTPDLTPQQVTLDPLWAAERLGVAIAPDEVGRLLRRMGHGVEPAAEGALQVAVPAYRNDIMHPIDLVEDVAIAYGYHNIVPELVPTMTVGSELPREGRFNVCRRALTGLGQLEVMTLILSSEEQQYDALNLPRRDDCVAIDNPISREQTIVRTSLLAGLLDTFSVNTDHELPQTIFEVGSISVCDPEAETGATERARVAAGAIGPKVDYAQIRSSCEALLREFGWGIETTASDAGLFIPGRGARVVARRGDERREVGLVGEVHPEVLERFKLVQPTALFELDLDAL